MTITRKIEIDMGHRIPNHKSKCSNPHGHRYVFEVGVSGEIITTEGDSSQGMIIDFSDLKEAMVNVIDKNFDHGFMIYNKDEFLPMFLKMFNQGYKIIIVDFIPTAENMGRYIFKLLDGVLKGHGINLKHLKVWETPNCMALITREDLD